MLSTRPDISVEVNILSKYTNRRNEELWKNIKRVFRYLQGTADLQLTYTKSKENELVVGFVDSDWGGQEGTDRRSTSGYLFKVYNKSVISWCTKRQKSAATS